MQPNDWQVCLRILLGSWCPKYNTEFLKDDIINQMFISSYVGSCRVKTLKSHRIDGKMANQYWKASTWDNFYYRD